MRRSEKNGDPCFWKSGDMHGACSPDCSRMSAEFYRGTVGRISREMGPLGIQASLHQNEIFFTKNMAKGPHKSTKLVCIVNIIITGLCIHKIHEKTGINSIIVVR